MTKELCVVDACGLINSNGIELGGRKILAWMYCLFNLIAPGEVNNELRRQRRTEEARISKQLVIDHDYSKCLEIAKRWYYKRNLRKEYDMLDSGEKHCMALALSLSRNQRRSCSLLTDDVPAKKTLNPFFQAQKVGSIFSTDEVIVQIYGLFPELSSDYAIRAVSDFFLSNPPREPHRKDFIIEELKSSCRYLGREHCFQECVHTTIYGVSDQSFPQT